MLREIDDRIRNVTGIVHLAAIPAPGLATNAVTFATNTISTYNVFEAARQLGIKNVVWASSETVLGLPFDTPPPYIPIDEEYPGRPEWAYSLSKLMSEEMAKQFCRWDPQLKIIGLRFSNIMEPQRFPGFQDDARKRKWNFWGYIDDPKVISDTVATPIEQEVNGVQDMLYMSSQSTGDGTMILDVTFKLGTNIDIAQVLVQNRVAIAEPRLPDQVRALGVSTKKKSSNLMLVVNLLSPDNTYDQNYISNYAYLQIRDVLNRVEGVGDVVVLGAREYSMRVWLDPDKMWSRQLATDDVIKAIQAQNVQVAAGRLGSEPAPPGTNLELSVNTEGRLITPEQFSQILLKHGDRGELVYLGDVARVELGAR
jgi:AcrB/AcrD/AcrF family protein/NAD-dependent epimerase/dehydratase family protein